MKAVLPVAVDVQSHGDDERRWSAAPAGGPGEPRPRPDPSPGHRRVPVPTHAPPGPEPPAADSAAYCPRCCRRPWPSGVRRRSPPRRRPGVRHPVPGPRSGSAPRRRPASPARRHWPPADCAATWPVRGTRPAASRPTPVSPRRSARPPRPGTPEPRTRSWAVARASQPTCLSGELSGGAVNRSPAHRHGAFLSHDVGRTQGSHEHAWRRRDPCRTGVGDRPPAATAASGLPLSSRA